MTYEVNDNKDIKKVHDETLAIHRLAAKSQIKQLQLDQDGKYNIKCAMVDLTDCGINVFSTSIKQIDIGVFFVLTVF